ncbi:hypothetical protein CGLO_18244 [Colletotrichum gloeosporioides Cg-14]|uniref:Uncharacterized protein n=1 Tax=Colletotrichum gloeosporioides (strain Cg-14) TaxID=1237896 RepID=T0JRX9_COLGC|nr:hypothetical protein CGLO_18244 [Colletotrichum gloeosporioides Cg-14]
MAFSVWIWYGCHSLCKQTDVLFQHGAS